MAWQVLNTPSSTTGSRLATSIAEGLAGFHKQNALNQARQLERDKLNTEVQKAKGQVGADLFRSLAGIASAKIKAGSRSDAPGTTSPKPTSPSTFNASPTGQWLKAIRESDKKLAPLSDIQILSLKGGDEQKLTYLAYMESNPQMFGPLLYEIKGRLANVKAGIEKRKDFLNEFLRSGHPMTLEQFKSFRKDITDTIDEWDKGLVNGNLLGILPSAEQMKVKAKLAHEAAQLNALAMNPGVGTHDLVAFIQEQYAKKNPAYDDNKIERIFNALGLGKSVPTVPGTPPGQKTYPGITTLPTTPVGSAIDAGFQSLGKALRGGDTGVRPFDLSVPTPTTPSADQILLMPSH